MTGKLQAIVVVEPSEWYKVLASFSGFDPAMVNPVDFYWHDQMAPPQRPKVQRFVADILRDGGLYRL